MENYVVTGGAVLCPGSSHYRLVLTTRHHVWASTFQVLCRGSNISGIKSGLRRSGHQVWASTFQALGLGFPISSFRSGLRRFGQQVWASTFQAFGLGFDVSDLRSGLRHSAIPITFSNSEPRSRRIRISKPTEWLQFVAELFESHAKSLDINPQLSIPKTEIV